MFIGHNRSDNKTIRGSQRPQNPYIKLKKWKIKTKQAKHLHKSTPHVAATPDKEESMKKIVYWIVKTIRKNKDCGCFCPTCEHYEACRYDG